MGITCGVVGVPRSKRESLEEKEAARIRGAILAAMPGFAVKQLPLR